MHYCLGELHLEILKDSRGYAAMKIIQLKCAHCDFTFHALAAEHGQLEVRCPQCDEPVLRPPPAEVQAIDVVIDQMHQDEHWAGH